MTKKLSLALSVLALIPALSEAHQSLQCNAEGQCVYINGTTRTAFNTSSANASSSGGKRAYAFSSRARSRGLSSGRAFGSGRGLGLGASAAGSTSFAPTAEGAFVQSPGMFVKKEETGQGLVFTQPAMFNSGIAMNDSTAQAITGVGVIQGQPDLPPGSKPGSSGGSGGSGGYGTFFSGK